LPLDVAQHATGIALEPTQGLAHPFELPGMGEAADLTAKPGTKTIVVLAQTDVSRAGQPDQLAPRCVIQSGVGGMRDVLLHHCGRR